MPTGLALLTFSTAANSATQLGTTPEMRGRVMGLYLLVFLGGTPLGAPLVGWVAEQFGPRMSLFAGGAISAVAAVVVGGDARAQPPRARPRLPAAEGYWPGSWRNGPLNDRPVGRCAPTRPGRPIATPLWRAAR